MERIIEMELAVGEFLLIGPAAVKLIRIASAGQVKLGVLAPRAVLVERAERRHFEEQLLPDVGGEAGGA